MLTAVRVCLAALLLVAVPVWSQVASNDMGDGDASSDSSGMQTPPPVSDVAYPTEVLSEARSNYLRTGLFVTSSYIDNVLPDSSSGPIGDTYYSISPTIALDRTTPRFHQKLAYSPGVTFYQHMSSLNEVDHSLTETFQYLFSPHVAITIGDSFRKSSNAFNQQYALRGEPVSGSTQGSLSPILAPVADQLNNTANINLTYQLTRNGMAGASGVLTNLHYPNPSEVVGLSDSSSRGGTGFYNYRLSKTQYFGVTYQYWRTSSLLRSIESQDQPEANTETRTHAVLFFLTTYLAPKFSLSLSAGPQHYDVTESVVPPFRSWLPVAMVSIGWQGRRTSLAASYSHAAAGGGGLQGAFSSNSGSVSAGWLLARDWTVRGSTSYTNNTNVSQSATNPGGHTISTGVTIEHSLTDHFQMNFGYMLLSQSYPYISAISYTPNVNRGFISLSYNLSRPLGR